MTQPTDDLSDAMVRAGICKPLGSTPNSRNFSTELLLQITERVHRWRFLSGERRGELIILADHLLAEIQRLEVAAVRER